MSKHDFHYYGLGQHIINQVAQRKYLLDLNYLKPIWWIGRVPCPVAVPTLLNYQLSTINYQLATIN